MRVLFVSCDPLEGAVTRYRCLHLAEALRAAGHEADTGWIGQPLIRLRHDLVVLHRICANAEGRALARAVRRSGAGLVYGADDLVWDADAFGADPAFGRARALAPLHAAQLADAGAALVSTAFLAACVQEAGYAAAVVRNLPRWGDLGETARPAERPCLAYFAGTPTHDADLAWIADPLTEVLDRFPSATLLLVGPVALPDALARFAGRIRRLERQPYARLPALFSEIDINLAPLQPSLLNVGKSELKWLEAACARVPTVASRIGGFAEVVRDGSDGVLADDATEWVRYLSWLIEKPDERRWIGEAACRRVATPAAWEASVKQTEAAFARLRARLTPAAVRPRTVLNPRGWMKARIKAWRKERAWTP